MRRIVWGLLFLLRLSSDADLLSDANRPHAVGEVKGTLSWGLPLREGTRPDETSAVLFDGEAAGLRWELPKETPIRAIALMADGDDTYLVGLSRDGRTWSLAARALPEKGAGLRTRYATLPPGTTARFLRVHAQGGDGHYAVARVSATRELPPVWPPKILRETGAELDPALEASWRSFSPGEAERRIGLGLGLLCVGVGLLAAVFFYRESANSTARITATSAPILIHENGA